MGSEISSCCGASSDADSQIVTHTSSGTSSPPFQRATANWAPQATEPSPSPGATAVARTGTELSSVDLSKKPIFQRRFESGVEVNLILQDKTKLVCQVKVDRSSDFILLSCDAKVRAIGMSDIKALLHTPEQLRRVETSAGITDASTCAAIHLAASGNCIPLFFTNHDDKQWFVTLVEEARAAIGTATAPNR